MTRDAAHEAPAGRIRVELTRRQAEELSSWCAYLHAAPTDWEESGGDARAVAQAETKIDRVLAGRPPKAPPVYGLLRDVLWELRTQVAAAGGADEVRANPNVQKLERLADRVERATKALAARGRR